MYPYFEIFSYNISSYWLMMMLGIFAAIVFLALSNRRIKLPNDDVLHIALLLGIGGLIGSKLLYIITVLPKIIANFSVFIASEQILIGLMQGGFVFYGGFIGALASALWYCKRYNVSFAKTLTLFTPVIPLVHAFGRVGCFLAGCCWGIEVSWGVVFTQSLAAPNGVALLPVQLIEAGLNLAIFAVLIYVQNRKAKTAQSEGFNTLGIYILLYGTMRFIIEFFRGDVARGVWIFSTGQWISLLFILAVGTFHFSKRKRGNPQ